MFKAIQKYDDIPYCGFSDKEFKLLQFDKYCFTLESEIRDNTPDSGNNPNYKLFLILNDERIYFSYESGDYESEFRYNEFFRKYINVNFKDEYNRSFNSIYSMFELAARIWANERYEKDLDKSVATNDDLDDDESDGD